MSDIPSDWNENIAGLPGANLLQTREWAGIKAAGGWQALPQVWHAEDRKICAAALVLRRTLHLGGFAARLCVLYVPRGPLLDWSNAVLRGRVLADLETLGRRQGAIFLKMDPEVVLGRGIPGGESAEETRGGVEIQEELRKRGWRFSTDQIQFRNTAVLDLSGDENEWLTRMKQKTRYNLRLAQRKGVNVRKADQADFPALHRLYAQTAVRDGFVIRPQWYYEKVWNDFTEAGMCYPLIAEADGEILAGLVLMVFAGRAWYLYGMSSETQREKMPNYLLQWEAMRVAKAAGARWYDLWGAPDEFTENDPMWGVYRFKEGLGAEVVRTLGAWDYPARPGAYWLYTQLLPRILDRLRRRGNERIRREVSA